VLRTVLIWHALFVTSIFTLVISIIFPIHETEFANFMTVLSINFAHWFLFQFLSLNHLILLPYVRLSWLLSAFEYMPLMIVKHYFLMHHNMESSLDCTISHRVVL